MINDDLSKKNTTFSRKVFWATLSVVWRKKTCKTRDGQHLLLRAYLLRRRLRFYVGSLHAHEEATTSHLRQPPQGRSMRSARSLSPPQAAREGSVVESNMGCLRLPEPVQHVIRHLCSSWSGRAVRTLKELTIMKERSQRFDRSANEQIHTEAAELSVLHVKTKHHSASLRRPTNRIN